ncbi:TetR family transcriptional regulator [Streptomyces sp. R39]|uniref:TetR family transcriptional regulator n=1 Tax=Streptomyces sp. R39 TaxID=3238631 RepID=A0AB39QCC3_9ACTN|nr:TetR family transcriptional regulator [Streptomyces shenzhenensis]
MGIRPQSHYARGQARRERLLDATAEVIAVRGLEGVTHRSVAAAAGLPASTTSYFFASMDELIGAAVTRIADGVLEATRDLVADVPEADGGTSALEYVDRLIDIVIAAKETLIRAQFEAYLATSRRPELVEPVQRIVQALEDAAESMFAFLGAPDPRLAGRELVAMLDGFALQRLAHPRPDDRAVLRDALRRLTTAHLGQASAPS